MDSRKQFSDRYQVTTDCLDAKLDSHAPLYLQLFGKRMGVTYRVPVAACVAHHSRIFSTKGMVLLHGAL